MPRARDREKQEASEQLKSRLKLPNEAITAIFEHVVVRHWDVDDKNRVPPADYLLVCKQLRRLLKPLWFTNLDGPSEAVGSAPADSLEYYTNLVLKGAATHTRTLGIRFQQDDCNPRTVFAFVPSCQSLETLRLFDRIQVREGKVNKRQEKGVGRASEMVLPEFVLAACSALPKLKCLDFSHDYRLPEWELPSPPNLESIEMLGVSLRPRMAQYLNAVGIKHLFLLIEEPAKLANLPWEKLKSLTLSIGHDLAISDMDAVRLEISLDDHNSDLEYPSVGWGSLEGLKITANVDLAGQGTLRKLLDFIRRSPNITTLELWGYQSIDYEETIADFEGDRYAELAPFLAALLESLRSTAVLRFSSYDFTDALSRSFGHYDGKATPVFRCFRANRHQDFTRELWWSIKEIA